MDVHKGSGEPAFTAEWVEEDQSVYFTSYINYKFRLNVSKAVIKAYLHMKFNTLHNSNKE